MRSGRLRRYCRLSTDLDLFDLRIPGRAVSALADTATVALLFLIGVRWFGFRVGVLAALLAAFAVIHIQLSHFFAVDGVMTLFIVAGVFFSIRVAKSGRRLDSLLAGLMVGARPRYEVLRGAVGPHRHRRAPDLRFLQAGGTRWVSGTRM